jgi:hypothetical protein
MTNIFKIMTTVALCLQVGIASAQAGGKFSRTKSKRNEVKKHEVRSAYDAEEQIKQTFVEQILLLKSGFENTTSGSSTVVTDMIGNTLLAVIIDSFTQTTETGAKFKFVSRGTLADPRLGPGWMDESGYIWFYPVLDENKAIVISDPAKRYEKVKKLCKQLGAETPLPERFYKLSEYFGSSESIPPLFFYNMRGQTFVSKENENAAGPLFTFLTKANVRA